MYHSAVNNARHLHFWITKCRGRGSSNRGTFPHFAWALPDQPDYTTGPYPYTCHLQLAPISACHPVSSWLPWKPQFHVGCFEQLLGEKRGREAEMTLFPRPGRTPGNFLLKTVVHHASVAICTSALSFLFLQKAILVAETAGTWI